jgi:hypothetical protein
LGSEGSGNGGGDAGWEGIWNEGCAIGGDVVGKDGGRMAGVGRAEQGEGKHMRFHTLLDCCCLCCSRLSACLCNWLRV